MARQQEAACAQLEMDNRQLEMLRLSCLQLLALCPSTPTPAYQHNTAAPLAVALPVRLQTAVGK